MACVASGLGIRDRRTLVTPTQRSLKRMRDMGYLCDVVERWIPRVNIRKDLFGFIDLVGIGENGEWLLVQATSASNCASRVNKIAEHENIARVRKANARIEVWAWGKRADGKWACRVVDCS